MNRRVFSFVAALLILALYSQTTFAQYYTWGSDAPNLKWSSIKDQDIRIIYPDTVDAVARRTLDYFNAAKGSIDFGFEYPPMKIPIVMHPENFSSNALVMWMPKRIDFLTTPSIDTYSMLWCKQLAAHEYRHVVQYNNLNRGVVRGFSYILGEQGSSAGFLFLPLYILEGDAVKCETSMSSYGRGLQPSFSIGYRAIGRDMLEQRNIDRWFCGSYQEYIPDHYKFGYQVVDYSYTRFNENIWNRIAQFGVRRPYYITTVSTGLKKFYGLNNTQLIRDTFNDLFDYWESLPERENSTEIISKIDSTNYTTYSYPTPIGQDRVVAIKSDYAQPYRFIEIDTETNSERDIAYIGSLSTRPAIGGDRAWWSEYRSSKLYMQKVNSQLCYMDLEREKPRFIKGFGKALYPTPIDQSREHFAYVEYDPNGT